MSIIAPSGVTLDQFWKRSVEGISCTETSPLLTVGSKSQVAAVVKEFNPETVGLPTEERRDLDRYALFALAGARDAALAAGLLTPEGLRHPSINAEDLGVSFATAIGGTPLMEEAYAALTDRTQSPMRYLPPTPGVYEASMFNAVASRIGRMLGAAGPCTTVSTGCTAGADAIGNAYDTISAGEASVMLAGASEAPLANITFAAFDVIGALSTANGDPARASRPFDANRDGFVLSEGAAFLVLEELESARARGAPILAEVLGFSSANNAHHMTDLPADGDAMARTIRNALERGGVSPEEVGYINAHGSSTPQNDVFETNAYKAVFGPAAYRIPISSSKSMIGHALAAASAIGTVATILALRHRMAPPTINQSQPDPRCDLDYVPNHARPVEFSRALITASGFSGIHSALVVGRAS